MGPAAESPVKRGRGRPPKAHSEHTGSSGSTDASPIKSQPAKRSRGRRPKKEPVEEIYDVEEIVSVRMSKVDRAVPGGRQRDRMLRKGSPST